MLHVEGRGHAGRRSRQRGAGEASEHAGEAQIIDAFEQRCHLATYLGADALVLAKLDEDRADQRGLGVVVAFEYPPVEGQTRHVVLLIEVALQLAQDARLATAPVAEHADRDRQHAHVRHQSYEQLGMHRETEQVDIALIIRPHAGALPLAPRPDNRCPTYTAAPAKGPRPHERRTEACAPTRYRRRGGPIPILPGHRPLSARSIG